MLAAKAAFGLIAAVSFGAVNHIVVHNDQKEEMRRLFLEHLSKSPPTKKPTALSHVTDVRFPEPRTQPREVNMMPFVMNDLSSLPKDLAADYGDMIKACVQTLTEEEQGRVGYLTVHESFVPPGKSQRRPGLHTEGYSIPPSIKNGIKSAWGWGQWGGQALVREPTWHMWGMGKPISPGRFQGGIVMASNVSDSCHLYNVRVPQECVGPGGDVEHLRNALEETFPGEAAPGHQRKRCRWQDAYAHKGQTLCAYGRFSRGRHPVSMQAGELYWITDTTPHESRCQQPCTISTNANWQQPN